MTFVRNNTGCKSLEDSEGETSLTAFEDIGSFIKAVRFHLISPECVITLNDIEERSLTTTPNFRQSRMNTDVQGERGALSLAL